MTNNHKLICNEFTTWRNSITTIATSAQGEILLELHHPCSRLSHIEMGESCPCYMRCFVRGEKKGDCCGGGSKDGMKDQFILENLLRIYNFGCGKLVFNGRVLMFANDKINEIVANKQCFKLDSSLRECCSGELFINHRSGNINGDDGSIKVGGNDGNHFKRMKKGNLIRGLVLLIPCKEFNIFFDLESLARNLIAMHDRFIYNIE